MPSSEEPNSAFRGHDYSDKIWEFISSIPIHELDIEALELIRDQAAKGFPGGIKTLADIIESSKKQSFLTLSTFGDVIPKKRRSLRNLKTIHQSSPSDDSPSKKLHHSFLISVGDHESWAWSYKKRRVGFDYPHHLIPRKRLRTPVVQGQVDVQESPSPNDNTSTKINGSRDKHSKKSNKEGKPQKQRKERKRRISCPRETPDLPEEFKNKIDEMGGQTRELVIQKVLTGSDINKNANRLSMPMKQINSKFLRKEEVQSLEAYRLKQHKDDLKCLLIQPSLRERTISIRKWITASGKPLYALSGAGVDGWNKMVEENQLVEDDVVQVWSFRIALQLCFALVIVQRAPTQPNHARN